LQESAARVAKVLDAKIELPAPGSGIRPRLGR